MPSQYKIFTDTDQYSKERRSYLAEILRPFVNQRTIDQNRVIYGSMVDQYVLVEEIENADWVVLPLTWNYYHQSSHLGLALDFIDEAKQTGKPVITWVSGDCGARIPVSDVWVFGAAGYKSRAGSHRLGTPVFVRDPLLALGLREIHIRTKGSHPQVGFCGYANTSLLKSTGFMLRTMFRNTACAFHWSGDELQEPSSPILLRQHILELLRQHPGIGTDFTTRSRYMAGADTKEKVQIARSEFYENVRDNDYTVCVRGGGNFSARLYETLAMGRIPILVDTDCLLPFSHDPRWRECCVYVERHEISSIAEKVLAFHESLSGKAFAEVQRQARRFWEERLSFTGFFHHFPELIQLS